MSAENDFLKALKHKFSSPLVVHLIYGYLCDLWREHIVESRDSAYVDLLSIGFPKRSGIDINMMPFVLGDKSSLPKEYHGYWPMISKCLRMNNHLAENSIGYLTIDESLCRSGMCHRRGGLHTDSNPPGNLEPAFLNTHYQS